MIEINNLVKQYGDKRALKGISFTVNDDEVLGFLGPNGAGKTTTMNIITGFLSSTSGSVKVNGHDILEEPELAKKDIGYLPEQPPLYFDMTVKEYLDYICDLKKVSKENRKKQLDSIYSMVKIADVKDRLIGNLSKGYKQRVGIAQALVGNPSILILDEPTVGLDPNQVLEMRKLVKTLSKTHSVIISSHILSEIQAIADRVVIINNGKIVVCGELSEIKRQHGQNSLVVRAENPNLLIKEYGAASASNDPREVIIQIPENSSKQELMRILVERFDVDAVRLYEPSLNDIFINYSGAAN